MIRHSRHGRNGHGRLFRHCRTTAWTNRYPRRGPLKDSHTTWHPTGRPWTPPCCRRASCLFRSSCRRLYHLPLGERGRLTTGPASNRLDEEFWLKHLSTVVCYQTRWAGWVAQRQKGEVAFSTFEALGDAAKHKPPPSPALQRRDTISLQQLGLFSAGFVSLGASAIFPGTFDCTVSSTGRISGSPDFLFQTWNACSRPRVRVPADGIHQRNGPSMHCPSHLDRAGFWGLGQVLAMTTILSVRVAYLTCLWMRDGNGLLTCFCPKPTSHIVERTNPARSLRVPPSVRSRVAKSSRR